MLNTSVEDLIGEIGPLCIIPSIGLNTLFIHSTSISVVEIRSCLLEYHHVRGMLLIYTVCVNLLLVILMYS